MKRILLAVALFLLTFSNVKAQQYGLFNTGTLFDALENPAQKHFTLDSSRKFSSNFFLPYFGLTGTQTGNTDNVLRIAITQNVLDTRGLRLGDAKENTISLNSNTYFLAFKLYKSYKYNQEIGISWQLRTDGYVNYTSESLAIFDSFRRFTDPPYTDVFNTKGYNQVYHQISVSYREDINKQLSFGTKLSLLNGVAFNSINIKSSYFNVNNAADQLVLGLNGQYRGSFSSVDSLSGKDIFPLFKNPGLSISAGFKYKSKSGYTIMGNIKDLGFLWWNKKSYKVAVNNNIVINNLSAPNTNSRISNEMLELINDNNQRNGFFSVTNARADMYVSRTFGIYTPAFILSKNLFYPGGNLAMPNTLQLGRLSGSVIPSYDLRNILMVGLQALYKTPNFEAFMGSDDAFKTVIMAGGIIRDTKYGRGYNGASFYMGLGFKFGRVVQHPLNSDYIPGVGADDPKNKSFLQRIFSKKKKPKDDF